MDVVAAEYRLIPLANGGNAIVDERDFEKVACFAWHKRPVKGRDLCYAGRIVYEGRNRRLVFMHRFLFGLGPEDKRIKVDHKNSDGLDNRRSCNLRLASHTQNMANRRKGVSASRFKGAYWSGVHKKWTAQIRVTMSGIKKTMHLGVFGTEEEAAVAYKSVAPLFRDPNYLRLQPIPEASLPDVERCEEIRRVAIEKAKAILRGAKGALSATSKYHGVNTHNANAHSEIQSWRCQVRYQGKMVELGYFPEEIEAAFARDIAVDALGMFRAKRNGVTADQLSSLNRADEVRAKIKAKLSKTAG